MVSELNVKPQPYKFRDNINKDSLFNVSIMKLSKEIRKEYTKIYKEGNEQSKEFLLFMISMPEIGKKELIENLENRKAEIFKLKAEYPKFVPKDYIVDIEFEPENKIVTVPELITIKIYKIKGNDEKKDVNDHSVRGNDNLTVVSQNWNLIPGSKKLENVLKILSWTGDTLLKIKKLLEDANCVSIANGEMTTIGFARSRMGKYSYKIFENKLISKESYDNGCEYIYYNENIVLQYGGGAVGPQCFESE